MAALSSAWSERPDDTDHPYGLCVPQREKRLLRLNEPSEEDREHAVGVIVGYCSSSRKPFMHVMPSKATSMDKFAAERIVKDIVKTSVTPE